LVSNFKYIFIKSKKINGQNHHTKYKKRPTNTQTVGIEEGRELDPLMGGNYFTHNPSNVSYM